MSSKKTYIYEGAVTRFGVVIDPMWKAETTATSVKKATSNLIFRYKKEHGLEPTAKIELPGYFVVGEE